MSKNHDQEAELVKKAGSDPKALAYLRKEMEILAGKVADKYPHSGVPKDELVKTGMQAFERTLRNYKEHQKEWDSGKGKPSKFSTYFTGWIEKTINEKIKNENED